MPDHEPDSSREQHLAIMRHSCAHLMAAAIQAQWPNARFGIGPAIEDGFYYDIEFAEPITREALAAIEQRMRALQERQIAIVGERWSINDALRWAQQNDQPYKAEMIEQLRDTGVTDGTVTMYRLGTYVDLCRGPHVAHTGEVGYFRLMSIAGAYWRGDATRPQLTRIYGLCYDTQAALDERLWQIEEARKRDHRVLGKKLGIFALSEAVGAGLPLWLPNGMVIRLELERLARQWEGRDGYRPVSTPSIARDGLYLKSGHLPYYEDDMYAPIDIEGQRYFLRPMCCPHHHEVYLAEPRSYRDLPLRLAEYGQVFRHEASGALSGLMRTRGFCQNDAHIYCREDQAKDEFIRVMRLHQRYYDLFGIKDYVMRLSLPDLDGSDKYVDDPAQWSRAIAIIRAAMAESGLPCVEAPGEAAFYGPKIDFMIRSSIGRHYAISTNQLDFVASRRFGLHYIGEDGKEHPVYVIHRAPLGSHERFTAFLIEHYAGALPIWLAPTQAIIIPVSDRHRAYAQAVRAHLREVEAPTFDGCLRVEIDETRERMQKKILTAQQHKIPYMLIVGDQEARAQTVSIRHRDGQLEPAIGIEAFVHRLREEIREWRV